MGFTNDEKPELPSVRCVGYFKNKEDAVFSIENNVCDIFENTYNYAVLEHVDEGLYQVDFKPTFFRYNLGKKKYEKCEKPEIIGPYVGLSFG